MSTNVKLPDSADIHWHDGGGRPAGEEMSCKHDVTQDCPACAEETIASFKEQVAWWEEQSRQQAARIEELTTALEFLFKTKWKSVDRDNMEFEGRVTCYQLDKARAALKATA